MKDLFGKALWDYQTKNNPENLITATSISEEDEMEVAYLFRDFDAMPKIEQKALKLCKGKILDIGCGAGSHALYLQEKKFEITAIDSSKFAIETCKLRGIKNCEATTLLDFESQTQFDTLLLLMNGTGIFGSLKQIEVVFQKLHSLLTAEGQILIDSSDLIYMYDQDEDGAYLVPATGYYGELTFTIQYKNEEELPFEWLYLDYNTLQNAANANGFSCEMMEEGTHFDYLARLKKI